MCGKILGIIPIILFALFVALIVYTCCTTPRDLMTDYQKSITVDSMSKIENAIKNATEDVTSRNFLVVNLEVKKHDIKKYTVTCKGIDVSKLLKED